VRALPVVSVVEGVWSVVVTIVSVLRERAAG